MRQRGSDPVPAASRDPVTSWRYAQLVAAGFPEGLAARLARDGAMDLHALLELVDRGCPPALAVRIVAPLDDDRWAR